MSSQSLTIRQALAASLQPLVTAGALGQVSAELLSNPTPPCAMVADGEIEYDLAMGGGLVDYAFIVVVLVPFTSDTNASDLLDGFRDFAGATSIRALIEADGTLGGVIDDIHVSKASRPQLYERAAGATSLGCEWTVQVITKSTS